MSFLPRSSDAGSADNTPSARLTPERIGAMGVMEAQSAIRAAVKTTYLGEHKVLTRVLGRYSMLLSGDDIGFAPHVILEGYWESWLTLFFARLLKPGMTTIDVGANYGYYTLLFADAVGPAGQVIAIEPVPDTFAMLHDTVVINGFIERTWLVAGAAGAVPSSQAHVVVPAGEPKNAAIVATAEEGSIPVASFTIDELAAGLDRVDLVKIDVEGAEQDVIAGMRQTIARHRPAILLEFNAARYDEPRRFLDSLLAIYGSVQHVLRDSGTESADPERVVTERFGEDWLLFFA